MKPIVPCLFHGFYTRAKTQKQFRVIMADHTDFVITNQVFIKCSKTVENAEMVKVYSLVKMDRRVIREPFCPGYEGGVSSRYNG